MDKADFRKTCLKSGYASAYIADKYIEKHGDKSYTLDDLIAASRKEDDYRKVRESESLLGGYRTSKGHKEDEL